MHFQYAVDALGSSGGRFVEPVCMPSWHSSSVKSESVGFCPTDSVVLPPPSFTSPAFITAQSTLLKEDRIALDLTQAKENQFVQDHLK